MRSGLSARDVGQECVPAAGSRPFTEFLHETDAVSDGNQNYFHAWIGGDRVVEGTDRSDIIVAGEIGGDVAALQHIVQEYQAPRPQAGQHLFVVLGVARLVGVDEREVELLAWRQCAQGFQARADPELDPVGDPGFLPRRAGDRGPLLADVTAQPAAPPVFCCVMRCSSSWYASGGVECTAA